jgi:hypothetical protein
MKKSTKVTLTVVAAMGLAACRRHADPCESATFDATACSDAIRNGGYYWSGRWYPMSYSYPYPYYFDSYRTYVQRGGPVAAAPVGSYAAPAGAPASGVTRGGFGSTGAGHGSSGSGE